VKIKSWIKQIEARQVALSKERDKLDEVIAEMSELQECCIRAREDLQSARDSLSELV